MPRPERRSDKGFKRFAVSTVYLSTPCLAYCVRIHVITNEMNRSTVVTQTSLRRFIQSEHCLQTNNPLSNRIFTQTAAAK